MSNYSRAPKQIKSARIGTLFVYLDDETVYSWFKARATGNRSSVEKAKKEYGELIKSFVKKDLEKRGFTEVKITWSQKAGCSCGCSPGYVIKASGHKNSQVFKEFASNRLFSKAYFIRYNFEKGKLSRSTWKDPDTIPTSGGIYLRGFGFKKEKTQTIATTKDFNKYP